MSAVRLLEFAGNATFRLGWPVLYVYFKLYSQRTRVLVVSDNKLMLVKSWISTNSWGLPGGGANRGEKLVDAACRELMEEVGLEAAPEQLKFLASSKHDEHGLTYTANYFLLSLPKPIEPRCQRFEISAAGWFDKEALAGMILDQDTRVALAEFEQELWYNETL